MRRFIKLITISIRNIAVSFHKIVLPQLIIIQAPSNRLDKEKSKLTNPNF